MSDTPRTDAVVPHSLFDHTDADYMALVNLAHAMERELAAVIALCERMDSGAAGSAAAEKDASASTGCEYEISTQPTVEARALKLAKLELAEWIRVTGAVSPEVYQRYSKTEVKP